MKKPPESNNKVKLTIIILSYNVCELLIACLESIYRYNSTQLKSGEWEIIVPDNNSTDETVAKLKQAKYFGLTIIENKENIGFSAGNNIGAKEAKGKFVLFLNPDTVVQEGTIDYCLEFLETNPDVGAASVEVLLGNGKHDMTAHRGFPTPWNAFCFFSGLAKLFPHSRLFSGYTLGYLDLSTEHEVEAINGAFMMIPKQLGEKLQWFDEDFFWKGEDLDLCYRIKEQGYKIMYLPKKRIIHFKGSSNGHKKGSKTLAARFEVMRLFYKKHYGNKYPWIVKQIVFLGVDFKEFLAGWGL